jgi:uncharacterized protein YecT (DUF1311 family)
MILSLFLGATLQVATPAELRDHHCDAPEAQQDMNFCEEDEFHRADADLNRVWRRLIAQVQANNRSDNTGGEGERRWRAAQRAWVAFRDAECNVAGLDELGGSMEPMVVSGCLTRMTRARIAELEQPGHAGN